MECNQVSEGSWEAGQGPSVSTMERVEQGWQAASPLQPWQGWMRMTGNRGGSSEATPGTPKPERVHTALGQVDPQKFSSDLISHLFWTDSSRFSGASLSTGWLKRLSTHCPRESICKGKVSSHCHHKKNLLSSFRGLEDFPTALRRSSPWAWVTRDLLGGGDCMGLRAGKSHSYPGG